MSLEYLTPESEGFIRVMSEGLRSQLEKTPTGKNRTIWASIRQQMQWVETHHVSHYVIIILIIIIKLSGIPLEDDREPV